MLYPKIPVIVLQYGNFDLTKECIKSIRQQTVPVEVILIDGNSPGKTKDILESITRVVDRSILLDQNLGYAAANNIAIKHIIDQEKAEYFFVVNNDVILGKKCLEELVKEIRHHGQAGQICPQVSYPEGALQSAGGVIKQPLFEPQLRGHLEDPAHYNHPEEVTWAPGVGVLVRSQAVRAGGLIPEEYFLYAEDVDWSLRLRQAGWEVWYCPTAKLVHFDSASSGSFSERKAYYLTRSNVWLAKRWATAAQWRSFKRAMLKKMFRQSVKYSSKPAYVKGMWRGYLSGLGKKADGKS